MLRQFLILSVVLLLLGALFSAVYDMWHPNTAPTVATGIVMAAAIGAASVFLRMRAAGFPQSIAGSMLMLMGIGLFLRIAIIAFIPNKQVSDFQTFHELAVALENGDGFAYTGPTGLSEEVRLFLHRANAQGPLPTAFRLPGTPLLMSAIYAIGGPKPLFGKLLNAFLGACIGGGLFLLLRAHNQRLAFWSGLFSEVYPSGLFYTNLLGTEIHFTLGIIGAALLIERTVRSEKWAMTLWAWAAGLLIGFTSLIRPATQLILCAFAAVICSVDHGRKRAVIAGVLAIGIAIPLVAWGVRNYRVLGHFEWQTTEMGLGWFTMTRDIIPEQQERSIAPLTERFMKSQDEFEIARLGKEIGMKRLAFAIRDVRFVKTMLKNFMKPWKNDLDALNWCSGYDGTDGSAAMPVSLKTYSLLRRACELFYLTMLLLGVFGAAASLKRSGLPCTAGVLMLLFYFAFSALLMCVFQGQPRYHFPLMPVVFILAANAFGVVRPNLPKGLPAEAATQAGR